MSLKKYKEKRSFDKTPEPTGGKSTDNQLKFVIQKHDASRLHYDFRLEMEGVLKSWAVPKGPSTDPAVKRLAMMVEDHPYDYRTFEGIIPQGEYGGGTVMVWDEGTYEPIEPTKGRAAQEKLLLKELEAGSLKFVLHGKKLNGEFALVKTHGMAENSWLLIKHRDGFADEADITAKDKSVVSKKTIAQIAKTSDNIYGNNPPEKKGKRPAKATTNAKKEPKEAIVKAEEPAVKKNKTPENDIRLLLKNATKQKFPNSIKPMLATLVDKPFDEEGWLYEIKWDGYRAVTFINKGEVELKSRNEKPFNEKFYPVYDAIKKWNINAIVDGEIVVVNDDGHANFGALQNWRSEADGTLLYYLFDIVWYNGYDLTALPLTERRDILKQLVPTDNDIIQLSNNFETSGTEFLDAAKQMGLEGIMAKRKDSPYAANDRTTDWLKIKANKRQEVVIGGFTKNADTHKPFSSLLVGVFEKGKFIYTGKIGTGFNVKTQEEMMGTFKPLLIDKPAFSSEPDVNKPSRFRPNPPKATAYWLKPQLICEVSFAEMTSDGVMRHPSFEGMREDKKAEEVILEKEADTKKIVQKNQPKEKVLDEANYIKPRAVGNRKTLLNPAEEIQVKKVNGHELKFSNLGKIYWPKDNVTKRDMINYYYQIAPFILPYLKDRPQSLNRYPNGIDGESFYQKDVTGKAPDWAKTYLYHTDDTNADKHFLVGDDDATLLYMASLGCIELHPWNSTTKKPDNPTWCIIDLDPDKKTTFDQVIEAAQVTKQILDDLKVSSYPKTSGSTGLHIYIPLGAKYTYEQSKEFARIIVTMVHEQIPEYTSIERMISNRKGKMYLDFLQNRPGATIAAPYSLRPKPGATVSMPLLWEEVKKGLTMKDFDIHNAVERANKMGDIFKPVLEKGIDLKKVIAEHAKQMQ